MAQHPFVHRHDLGAEFDLGNLEASKIHVRPGPGIEHGSAFNDLRAKVDGTSIKFDANGALSVPAGNAPPPVITSVTFDPSKPKGLVGGVLNLPPRFAQSVSAAGPNMVANAAFAAIGPSLDVTVPRAGTYRVYWHVISDVVMNGTGPAGSLKNSEVIMQMTVDGVADPYAKWDDIALILENNGVMGAPTWDGENFYVLTAGLHSFLPKYRRIDWTNGVNNAFSTVQYYINIEGPINE